MSHYLTIKKLNKSYFKKENDILYEEKILYDINLSINRGKFITILGPNGCGKTTLLKIIAGLEEFDSGMIVLCDKKIEEAVIGFVFQNYAESLFPWRNNLNNIILPLQLQGIGRKMRRLKALNLLNELNIDINTKSYPYQLSGGQKQLLAIMRSLIHNPDLLLLDEPFSSLDYHRRFAMQKKIQEIWLKIEQTIIFVSHEIDEAIFLADTVLILSHKPSSIIASIDIDLPRPRDKDILTSTAFNKYKKEILTYLKIDF